ncbi:aminotransferase class I/II-fold pyridoxal phosphate-dependent enzyme [Aestuariibius sp. 2305UL40-4]|uniref:aminotransferase class I/II-fold pyridoxal phosphate-dependent enzyme n=1 Tax=Aestuariibius violaceus TaxID=3234132 RepID=UPI00345E53DE
MNEAMPNLTRYESTGINRKFNLADGHAHQKQNKTQHGIVSGLPSIFFQAESMLQGAVEREFQKAFFQLAGQHSVVDSERTMLCYSASLATDLIATFLSANSYSVTLLEPCFDNLATILMRRNVSLTPIREHELSPERLEASLSEMKTDALFLTLPNNPTGFSLDHDYFVKVVELCTDLQKILILDHTFRFYNDGKLFDSYQIMEDAGISYLTVEDTGKTWPTQDLKCSILGASKDLFDELRIYHNDILLNVSPFILRLLTEYVIDSDVNGLDKSVRDTIRTNRATLRKALAGTTLSPAVEDSTVSVEWLEINNQDLDSLAIVDALAAANIGILPGNHFYWHEPDIGSRFVRVALARDCDEFADACKHLQQQALLR